MSAWAETSICCLAFGADLAGEPLGDDGVERRGDEERLDPHVEQPVDGGRGVIGMERGEDEVPGQGGLDGDLGGFEIADLPDHDDIGVLPEERSQGGGEVKADVLVHLDLVDAHEVVFNRILGRHDIFRLLVQLGEGRIEGGGLCRTRSGR